MVVVQEVGGDGSGGGGYAWWCTLGQTGACKYAWWCTLSQTGACKYARLSGSLARRCQKTQIQLRRLGTTQHKGMTQRSQECAIVCACRRRKLLRCDEEVVHAWFGWWCMLGLRVCGVCVACVCEPCFVRGGQGGSEECAEPRKNSFPSRTKHAVHATHAKYTYLDSRRRGRSGNARVHGDKRGEGKGAHTRTRPKWINSGQDRSQVI